MANGQQPLQSPFAAKPSSLDQPVPGQQEEQDLIENFFTQQGTPIEAQTPETQAVEQAPQAVESFFQQGQPVEPLPETQPPLEDPTGLESLKEQWREMSARIKNSFAVTNEEGVKAIKELNMFEDVRLGADGEIEVKRPGRGQFEKLDRDKVELIGDSLDLSRDALEFLIEKTVQAGGTIGGALLGGVTGATVTAAAGAATPAAPVAAPAGFITGGGLGALGGGALGASVGGATGAVLAKNTGDFVAQEILGIERDPNRDITNENVLAGVMGGTFEFLGARAARIRAGKKAEQEAAQRTLDNATAKLKQAEEQIQQVSDAGIKLDRDGFKFKLDPAQTIGANEIPELDAAAKELSASPVYRDFLKQQGNVLVDAYETAIGAIANKAGRSAELGKDFVLTSQHVREAEGRLIGSFRKFAKKELLGQNLPAQRTTELTSELLEQFGGSIQNIDGQLRVIAPKVDDILRFNPSLTRDQATVLGEEITELARKLSKQNGSMRIDDIQAIYTRFTNVINRTINTSAGKAYADQMVKIKNAVRDDWTEMMGQVLPENKIAEYQASKARYSEILNAMKNMQNLLKTEDISKQALVSRLFQGKQSLSLARSAKTLIRQSDPDLWQDLTASYFDQLKLKHFDPVSETVSWNGILKDWTKLGPEMQKELLDGQQITPKVMGSLMSLGAKSQNLSFPIAANKPTMDALKRSITNLAILTGPTLAAQKGTAIGSLLSSMGKKQSVMKWLQDGAMEEILKDLPGMKPASKAAWRNFVDNWTPSSFKTTAQLAKQQAKTSIRRRTEEKAAEAQK